MLPATSHYQRRTRCFPSTFVQPATSQAILLPIARLHTVYVAGRCLHSASSLSQPFNKDQDPADSVRTDSAASVNQGCEHTRRERRIPAPTRQDIRTVPSSTSESPSAQLIAGSSCEARGCLSSDAKGAQKNPATVMYRRTESVCSLGGTVTYASLIGIDRLLVKYWLTRFFAADCKASELIFDASAASVEAVQA